MKFLVLIGDSAVGKMTVGQEIMKRTGLRLFHNHMTIEPILEIFGYRHGAAVNKLREVIFDEFVKTELPGMIFTYMWAFDSQSDWDYIAHVTEKFEAVGAEIFYAELVAPQEVRLRRNGTENRLKHKASKRDIEVSNQRLRNDNTKWRLESKEGELPFKNYIKVNNTDLTPEEAAEKIIAHFGW